VTAALITCWLAVPLGSSEAADAEHSQTRWRLQNGTLRVTLDAETGALTVLDKRNNYTWRQAEPVTCSAVLPIARSARPPAVDGDLAEWCGRSPAVLLTTDMTADAKRVDGPADLSGELWLGWDEGSLYLAARVRDDQFHFATAADREWWERDAVEFWVNGGQFGVALDPAAPALIPMRRTVQDRGDLVVKPGNGEYVVEGAFPWATLGLRAGEVGAGKAFRFAFGINDADSTGRREGQLYYPTTWQHSNPRTFAIAQFADESGRVAEPARPGPALRNIRQSEDGLRYEMVAQAGEKELTVNAGLSLPGESSDLVLETDLPDRAQPTPSPGPMRPFVLDSPRAFIAGARYCDGLLVDCDDMAWQGTRWFTYGDLDMPWVGVTDMDRGYLLLADTPDDAFFAFETVDVGGKKRLSPTLVWEDSKGQFGYARRMIVHFVDHGGYVPICKRYRAYAKERGYLVTQREKEKALPQLALLAGAPDVWGAWGIDFCREAKAAGIDRMLVNWRGSKEEMEEVKRLGYLIGEYDNYVDIQDGPLGSGPNKAPIPAAAIRNADGSPSQGWVTWDKKTVYMQLCAALAPKAAEMLIPPLLKDHPFNARFLDVTTAMRLRECYDAEHPLTRTGWRKANEALAKYVTGLGLVLGGEHGRWYGARYYNYWEGMQSGGFYSWPAGHVGTNIPQKREEIGEEYLKYGIGHYCRVPLWELCFHDCVTSTWYWGDSTGHLHQAAPELADKQDAFNALYGTIPLYWVNEPYSFKWRDPVLRERLLRSYRNTCKLHEQVFYDEMLSHEFVTEDHAVQRTRFASGVEVTVNFGEKPYAVGVGKQTYVLPQNGFVAAGGNFLAYQALDGDRKVDSVAAPRYFFCDPGGRRHDFGVVETSVPVTLRATEEGTFTINVGGPGATDTMVLRPARLTREWVPGRARLYTLGSDGLRERMVQLGQQGDPVTWPAAPGTYSLLWGAAAIKPDLAFDPQGLSITVNPPANQATASAEVANLGLKACKALAAVTVTTTKGEVELGRQAVSVGPEERRVLKVTFPTGGLDGAWPVTLAVRPEPAEEEFLASNNRATANVNMPAEYARWQHRAEVSVTVEAVDRKDEPVAAEVDLGKLFGVPADRLDETSLRVVEVDATGKLGQAAPAQFDGQAGVGELLFVLTGDTSAGSTRRYAVLCNEKAPAGPYTPAGQLVWNVREQSVTTPVYRAAFRDGVISSCFSLTGGQPRESFLRSVGVSSAETGWVDETGELQSFELMSWGPVRVVVRVAKKLRGDFDYTKTYAFYPDYFTVTTDANKATALYNRAYYLLPAQFEDDKGNKALVDGQGDAENVSGRNDSPKWYAMYADGWAHSCVALTPFNSLTYWDGGAWGGIGFGTGQTQGAELAYVIHAGEKDATFAIGDYDRLTHPPLVTATPGR